MVMLLTLFFYLDRLRVAISNDLELCCSKFRPGDNELNGDYWGKVGFIIQPRSADSITLVAHGDAGTLPAPNNPGKRRICRRPIGPQEVIDSIDCRQPGSANEWCVLDYEVAGLFIEPPIQYVENGGLHDIDVPDVFVHFPGLRVFAFCGSSLSEILPPQSWAAQMNVAEFYPDIDDD